jgi:hypothetical protein
MDDDEYDPFADEFVDDETPSWNVPIITLLSEPSPLPHNISGEKRKVHALEETKQSDSPNADGSPIENATSNMKCQSSAMERTSVSLSMTDADKVVIYRYEGPSNYWDMHQALWKSCWAYVKKFLRPYEDDGSVATEEDCHRLSKKLAQKVCVAEYYSECC